jgi:hypothetical protein
MERASKQLFGLFDPHLEERRKPLIDFLHTAKTARTVFHQYIRLASSIAPAGLKSGNRLGHGLTLFLTAAPCPEEFEEWARVLDE